MRYISLLFGFFLFSLVTEAKQTFFHTELGGFAPTLKIGFDKEINERWDLKGGFGGFVLNPSLLSYNLYYSYKITNPENRFNLNINFGMLDSYYSHNEHASFGFGIAPGVGWKTKRGNKMNFRLGFVSGPAFEPDRRRWLSIPDFGLEYDFKLKHTEN